MRWARFLECASSMTARSSKISRRASLRAPFVTAVAAGALVSACGGKADVDIGDAGTGGDANTSADGACTHCNPPPTNQCPADEPVGGSACAPSGKSCAYDDDCVPSGTAVYDCLDGKWAAQRGPLKTVACPANAPTDGSSCFVCNGEYPAKCDYDLCFGNPTRTAVCNATTLRWEVTAGGSCNPPPPPPVDAGTDPSDASTSPQDAPYDSHNPPPPVDAVTHGGG